LYNHDNTLTATMEFQYSQLQFNSRNTTQAFTMVLHAQDGASTGMELLITHVGTESLTTLLQQSSWYSFIHVGDSTHTIPAHTH
jgi:hypothetical protein